jgi:[protein-PII] uridylyltransferase
MSSGLRLNPVVLAAKEKLASGREKLRRQHDSGSPSVQVCAHFTSLLEELVIELYRTALDDLDSPLRKQLAGQTALIAHSGFGRREMAPYSDIDVMLLHSAGEQHSLPLVRRFTQHLYDLGLDVGFAARTHAQACQMAYADSTVFTALSESRLIAGDEELFNRFDNHFRWLAKRHWKHFMRQAQTARRDERRQYGETVFLLEPNVKRSRGTLRDLQLLRWVGYACYGESSPDLLMRAGHLTQSDLQTLRKARHFLLWLRNELHFHAGKANDLLDRSEQLRIAEQRGYDPIDGLMPVEQFMREYFHYTTDVQETVLHFVESCQPQAVFRWLFDPLVTHSFEGDFRVGPLSIAANRRGLAKLQGDVAEVLRLLDLANLYDKRIEQSTWQAIRLAMSQRPPADPNQPLPRAVIERFLSLVSQPARLGELLRKLHDLRVLEQIIPGMNHARSLLQFNAYHRYTVDEHSIRAVESLTSLLHDTGPPGEVYRSIRDKATLHLAMLIHDMGKGYPEDHSEVGLRLAGQLARRLELPQHAAEVLQYLVHKHLLMNDLAQRHDIHDANVVVRFAVEVGSPEILKMLYVLTLADLDAVGPGVLNKWKQQLLTDLYEHTLQLLASGSPAEALDARLQARRNELLELARQHDGQAWWRAQIAALPASYLFAGEPQRIVAELDKLRRLPHNDAIAWGHYVPERSAAEYTVGTYEEITPGIFHKLTGVLATQRQQILAADINTLAEGMVLDRFYVRDLDFNAAPPLERLAAVSQALVAALKDSSGKPPTFRKLWQTRSEANSAAINHMPSRVTIDNSTAERFTFVAIFAYDQLGLLYAVARTLFELDLSVSMAKIGTHLDQVVDSFYVTDRTGKKITDEHRLHEIQRRLLECLQQHQA